MVELFKLPNGQPVTYPAFVAALVKPGAAIVDNLTPDKAHAWHMASCIPGEAGELFSPIAAHIEFSQHLDRDNVIEELGDIEFYLEGLREVYGITREESTLVAATMNSLSLIYSLPNNAGDVFDVVKRWVIYNKPQDRAALISAILALETSLAAIRNRFSITLGESLAANVTKLGKRYVDLTYSDAAAQARADKEPNQ